MIRPSIVLLSCLLLPVAPLAAESRVSISNDEVLEILQYVYYWHLDHASVARLDSSASIDVFLFPMAVERDPGDNTEFVQLLVPALDLDIMLKKADYSVAEIGLDIRHPRLKIAAIYRNAVRPTPGSASMVRSYATKDVLAYFFEHRHQVGPLDSATLNHMRQALRALMRNEGEPDSGSSQMFHVGPISAYSNDIWIFWVQQKKLILFSSDMDISTNAYWDYLPLSTRIFDLDSGVVTSLNEAPGKSAYVTKSWAGRILFNTLVDGSAIRLNPAGQ